MPLVYVAKARRPRTNSRGRRPTKARDEALQDAMENVFSANWAEGIRRVRGGVSTQRMADAYYGKDYADVMAEVPFDTFNDALADAIKDLAGATKLGGAKAARVVPNLEDLRYDLKNPRIKDYLETRTGQLISGVTDDFQVSLQDMLRGRFQMGATTSDIKDSIGELLRDSIGLDPVSQGAYRNAEASGKYRGKDLEAYRERLLERRADNIARTEVAYAVNEGQMAVWDASVEQGLLEPNAQKVWVAEANPCEDCLPMDGIMVEIGENFLAPNGLQVSSPPLHPRCRCIMQLQVPDAEDVPGSNVQNYNPDDA